MLLARFRNHLTFALHKESTELRETIEINRVEKIGNFLSWLVYDLRMILQTAFRDPRTLTVFFTLFFMTCTAFLFYPTDTCHFFVCNLGWLFTHINWRAVRFAAWLICEITVLGLGMRAFGRFSNPELMKFHGVA